jgi:hypothetical protein
VRELDDRDVGTHHRDTAGLGRTLFEDVTTKVQDSASLQQQQQAAKQQAKLKSRHRKRRSRIAIRSWKEGFHKSSVRCRLLPLLLLLLLKARTPLVDVLLELDTLKDIISTLLPTGLWKNYWPKVQGMLP